MCVQGDPLPMCKPTRMVSQAIWPEHHWEFERGAGGVGVPPKRVRSKDRFDPGANVDA